MIDWIKRLWQRPPRKTFEIEIGRDFSQAHILFHRHPHTTTKSAMSPIGESGEEFRKFLVLALKYNDHVTVYMDGPIMGYGSSFINEAFAGLLTKENFAISQLRDCLTISYRNPEYHTYALEANRYIQGIDQ